MIFNRFLKKKIEKEREMTFAGASVDKVDGDLVELHNQYLLQVPGQSWVESYMISLWDTWYSSPK